MKMSLKNSKTLAAKLNNHEYEEIVDLIYNAHMGCDIGYADDDCLAFSRCQRCKKKNKS